MGKKKKKGIYRVDVEATEIYRERTFFVSGARLGDLLDELRALQLEEFGEICDGHIDVEYIGKYAEVNVRVLLSADHGTVW